MTRERWLLPEGIEEILPDDATRLELARRRLLDLYQSWGYELVVPPLIEYLDSLLTGTGPDLDLQTFKLTDQISGRLLGVRADMTPQVARIDAHRLGREAPTRLCYIGTVLRTRSDGFGGSRSPLQAGAELYGHAGIDSDVEILRLMLETLETFGLAPVHLDLGHIGIYRALASRAGLDADQEARLFDMLQRKSIPEIDALLAGLLLDADCRNALRALADLHGANEVLNEARALLGGFGDAVDHGLATLERLAVAVSRDYPAVEINFDLAELRGYNYETGVVFAAYVPGQGQEIARGGRYDGLGRDFGRARAAVGFTADLNVLLQLAPSVFRSARRRIFAPCGVSAEAVLRLRASGDVVVCALEGQHETGRELACGFQLVQQNAEWVVEAL